MDPLIQFRIPVKGLQSGPHEYQFQIDAEFFKAFEASPIQEGTISMTLDFDKRPDMFVLEFDFSGTVRTTCDRCLAEIDLPISDSQRMLVKYSLDEVESDDPDVVFIHPETQQLDVAPFAYDFILLAVPMIRTYDCESEEVRPCNQELLDYLVKHEEESQAKAEEEGNTPLRDIFKDWNNNNDR